MCITENTEALGKYSCNNMCGLGVALAFVQEEYFFDLSLLSVHQPVLPLMKFIVMFTEVYILHF